MHLTQGPRVGKAQTKSPVWAPNTSNICSRSKRVSLNTTELWRDSGLRRRRDQGRGRLAVAYQFKSRKFEPKQRKSLGVGRN